MPLNPFRIKVKAINQRGEDIAIPKNVGEDRKYCRGNKIESIAAFVDNPIKATAISTRILELYSLKDPGLYFINYLDAMENRATIEPKCTKFKEQLKKFKNPILVLVYLTATSYIDIYASYIAEA